MQIATGELLINQVERSNVTRKKGQSIIKFKLVTSWMLAN